MSTAYNYAMVQQGSLALNPGGQRRLAIPHRCTSVLIWAHRDQRLTEHDRPLNDATLLTDPCLSAEGATQIAALLDADGKEISQIDFIFETHQHGDHQLNLAELADRLSKWPYQRTAPPADVRIVCTDSRSLVYTTPNGERIWIAGDAILNEAWLLQWAFYWPNGYAERDIIDTWRSVARILAEADVIPGHGPPIPVTVNLLRELADGFAKRAKYAELCPDVCICIRDRVSQMVEITPENISLRHTLS